MGSESKHTKKKNFWREHSDAWKASELTQVAYCAQQGISYQSFTYQHKRMAMKSQRSTIGFVEAKPEAIALNRRCCIYKTMAEIRSVSLSSRHFN